MYVCILPKLIKIEVNLVYDLELSKPMLNLDPF